MTTLSMSRQLSLAIAGTVLAALGTANAAQALTIGITDRTALGANESVDWSVLGSNFTSVSNPFTVNGSSGTGVTGSLASGGFGRLDQGSGWAGNFAPGDALLWNQGNGTVRFAFSSPVRGVGTQIQANIYDSFNAIIEAFDSNGISLGSFNRGGISTGNADNSAIFIGLLSDQLDIASITFSVNSIGGNDFAINQLSLNSSATAIPTPALLPGLIGMGIATLRRRKEEAAQESSEA
ncbi:PTPA-CTERM sorting domain-containing protein [Leptolyngbya sp. ST-U4]|uniref:PTPA-CTERM sorting domain-containing protein n=1 Tax=Leptolyngbya sp. ST-U4 TaxID=2933912 RepID=UPI0032985219